MTTDTRHCPGAKSPFGQHTFRRCIEFCERYRWASDDMKPAMAWDAEAKARVCPNMVLRGEKS